MRDDVALLTVRLVTGGLLAGHGAQKLFGAFGGSGRAGTSAMMEHLNLRPAEYWGAAAGLSEFAGGALTALGLGGALGPIGILSAMTMAGTTVHWGKPIWVSEGGAELPLTNSAVALAVALVGPGRYSVDRALGIRVPRWITGGAALAAVGTIAAAHSMRAQSAEEVQEPVERAAPGDQQVGA